MSSMAMTSPAMDALMSAAMMVAMMLPSFAPTLWRHHRARRDGPAVRAIAASALFAFGYAMVWTGVGGALFVVSTGVESLRMASSTPWLLVIVLVIAGIVQRSRWKAARLHDCRDASSIASAPLATLRDGCALGVRCALSCAAPMAVLLVAGLMDIPAMLIVTAAITSERVTRRGARVARFTGSAALFAGVAFLCS